MDRKLTLTLGAACAIAAAVGAVLLTSAAAGRGAAGVSAQPGGPTVIEVSASPDSQPSPAAAPTAATPAAREPRPVVLAAEAQVLGVKPTDLAAQLALGTTVHQVADQKGITQADFQTRYTERLRAILDQQARSGRMTQAQEQQALQRLGTVPNWDRGPASPP